MSVKIFITIHFKREIEEFTEKVIPGAPKGVELIWDPLGQRNRSS